MMNNSNNNLYSASLSHNKQVFDLSLMKEKALPVKTELFKQENAASPGLDDSSVSTIGSNTSGLYSTGSARRSLFTKYWNKHGDSSSIVPSTPAIIEIADDHLLSQEESSHHGPLVTASSSPVTPRRSLFSQETRRSVSLNCLMEENQLENTSTSSSSSLIGPSPVRHKSEGHLSSSGETKKLASCLRESRFSFTKSTRTQRSSSICSEASSMVQFDMESTEVRHFVKPAEVHAEDGWTNYFY